MWEHAEDMYSSWAFFSYFLKIRLTCFRGQMVPKVARRHQFNQLKPCGVCCCDVRYGLPWQKLQVGLSLKNVYLVCFVCLNSGYLNDISKNSRASR